MKKFIRFLARITGVEEEIRKETIEELGNQIYYDSFWFTGSYYGRDYRQLHIVYTALQKIGVRLINKHRFSIDTIRDEIIKGIENEEDRA